MSFYSFVTNKLIFPLGDKLSGTHIVKSLRQLEEKQWWPPEKIKDEQDSKISAMMKHCYENVPYWRSIFDKSGLMPADIKTRQDLQKLPVVTKEDIRLNLDKMVDSSRPIKKLKAQHSSGSTGEPLKYYADKHQYSCRIASVFRFWKWAGFEFGIKWARLSLWPHGKFLQKFSDYITNCLYIHVYELDKNSIAKNLQKIRRNKPEVIRGYASAVYLMAKQAQQEGIEDIRPKSVITTGDNLFDNYRKTIEKQFNCKVYDTYGGEGMVISGQCELGNYHIDDNNVIVEFLRDDGCMADDGELANIIVTDLNNFAMPFIRYRIQDLGRSKAGLCKCGRGLSLMESIEGRDADIIKTLDNKNLIVHFFTALFEYLEGVEQFQIVQERLDEIEVKIVKNDKYSDKDTDFIRQGIKKGGGENLKVIFNFVDEIPLAASGKRRFVIAKK